MRYLAIDPGDKRTGLAVGDNLTGVANPIGIIRVKEPAEQLRHLEQVVREYHPDALLVGLARNMDGTEGPAAAKARTLAKRLATALDLPVHLVDERLSSYAADDLMSRSGLTHQKKRARRDALAAVTILRDYLAMGEGNPPPAGP